MEQTGPDARVIPSPQVPSSAVTMQAVLVHSACQFLSGMSYLYRSIGLTKYPPLGSGWTLAGVVGLGLRSTGTAFIDFIFTEPSF